MTNRAVVLLCAILALCAASLSAQMRELGRWHGGRFYGRDDRTERHYERRNELRREFRERRERLRERQRDREEFRREMREFRRSFRDRGWAN